MKNRDIKSVFLHVLKITLLFALFLGNSVASSNDTRFVDNKDGSVLDTKTNLTWHKTDYSLQKVATILEKDNLSLKDLEQFVRKLRTAGYSDWPAAQPRWGRQLW